MSMNRDTSSQSDISKMAAHDTDGSFKRAASSFRNVIEKGGKFEAEKDRYHLYVSYACPWATRTLIVRRLKGLEEIIPVSVVSPRMGADGWPFANVDKFSDADVDPLYNSEHIRDLYFKADPNYSGRFTVPVLWDKKNHTVVNNESSEIIRIFNTAFNDIIPKDRAEIDIYPQGLRAEIDSINEWVYDTVNNGVYKAGFARTQEAYQKAVVPLFDSLDRLEKILTGKDYLAGGVLTEADIRLWVTIIRFDPVYVGHFKCNIRTIRGGYPAIHSWMKKLYWNTSAFKVSTNFEHIKTHYYWSHPQVNPTRIVPVGPIPNIESL
jgi:putative glutathione S-transferase